jgi:predicted RNA-binding protein YlxR (DUF448 family)
MKLTMKKRKTPLRTCVITREQLPKEQLLRVVRNKELGVKVDLTGRLNGRGAYVKKDVSVIDKAQKTKALARHLEVEVPAEIYDELREIINNG